MASTDLTSDHLACSLPSQVVFLGEALSSVALGVRQALSRSLPPSGQELFVLQDAPRHMEVIQQALTNLSARLNGLMVDVIQNERAEAVDAGRAAGRFEQVLYDLVEGFLDVNASHAGSDCGQARTLILGVYRHYINEICDWVDELVQAIANPLVAMEKLGIPIAENVGLPIVLKMTSPPEMAKLQKLADQLLVVSAQVVEEQPSFKPLAPNGPGILGALGALAFGVGISKAILGRSRS